MVIVFIGLDPERDVPQQLESYVAYFDHSAIALTGTPGQIRRTADAFNVYYRKAPLDGTGSYTLDHTASVFLVGRDGRLVETIPTHEPHAQSLEKLRRLVVSPPKRDMW